ncbi:MAG: NADP-dependent phosphogluconate dehydrogenase, partial [Chlamydiia bacterium]|nr:NADP-dependent phosphogluconate dehydrogenase [Chlamydiia bacterium]
HYTKMVHNGIEYGDMQLICEAYDLMHRGLEMPADQLAEVFGEWNRGPLESYLIEITHKIFECLDSDNEPIIDKIVDRAGQKGTGKWTVASALDLGIPASLIGEAVFARCLSALKDERNRAHDHFPEDCRSPCLERKSFIDALANTLYATKILSYAQGFMLMREAAKEYNWNLDFGAIAHLWEGGCIIRSRFLQDIEKAFNRNVDLENLLFDDFFKQEIQRTVCDWRRVSSQAILWGIPTPCILSALSFFDGYRSARLPANLLQAQRDYFGAHQFERIDRPGEFHHHDWIGSGGLAHSGTYTR